MSLLCEGRTGAFLKQCVVSLHLYSLLKVSPWSSSGPMIHWKIILQCISHLAWESLGFPRRRCRTWCLFTPTWSINMDDGWIRTFPQTWEIHIYAMKLSDVWGLDNCTRNREDKHVELLEQQWLTQVSNLSPLNHLVFFCLSCSSTCRPSCLFLSLLFKTATWSPDLKVKIVICFPSAVGGPTQDVWEMKDAERLLLHSHNQRW